jgi:hypothetical protein
VDTSTCDGKTFKVSFPGRNIDRRSRWKAFTASLQKNLFLMKQKRNSEAFFLILK